MKLVASRVVRAFLLCVCSVMVFANGAVGQGGGGGGQAGGGGMGGGMTGGVPSGDTYSSSNILSPGDISDWPFEVRDGETLIISVKSSVFDPMVEIVGANKKKIAENDDVRRGVQESLLLHYFPKGGKYTALVKAAKQGAGGAYRFSVRRCIATETRVGTRTAGSLDKSQIQWHRFAAEAGQTLVLTASAASQMTFEVIAPNGEGVTGKEPSSEERGTLRLVFRAISAGTHYVRLNGAANLKYALTIALARVFQLATGQMPVPKKMEIGGLDLWKFQGKAGEFVNIRANSAGRGVTTSLEYLPPTRKADAPELIDASMPTVQLPAGEKESGQMFALLNRTGAYQIAISQANGQEVTYALSVNSAAKPLPPSGAGEGKLAIGRADYWAFEGKAGEVIRFGSASEQFDMVLSLFSPEGE